MTKQKKTVEIERTSYIYYDRLLELIKSVPKAYRNSLELKAEEFYYPYDPSPSHAIIVTYERLETDEEEHARLLQNKKDTKRYEAFELETLKALQEKYKGKV